MDGAMMLTQQAEAYKKQHEEMYKRLSTPDRTMTVCEVCGVFINSADVDDKKWGGKVPQPILVSHACMRAWSVCMPRLRPLDTCAAAGEPARL